MVLTGSGRCRALQPPKLSPQLSQFLHGRNVTLINVSTYWNQQKWLAIKYQGQQHTHLDSPLKTVSMLLFCLIDKIILIRFDDEEPAVL